MTRSATRLVAGFGIVALAGLGPTVSAALGQTLPPPTGKPGARGRPTSSTSSAKSRKQSGPPETRFRLILNFAVMPTETSYGDTRTPIAFAEPSSIRTTYDAGLGLGPDLALQVSLYHGLGLLAGYSLSNRDVTGTVDVSRPHPLFLNRPRSASAELSGYSYKEGAFDFDLAYARSAGGLDWALFAGVTFFQVEADLLDAPTFDERYPYDTLVISATPSVAVEESATGFNVGGRLDYRFGSSRRFGVGVQVRYSSASLELPIGADASPAAIDAGGLSVAGGLRIYF